MADGALPANPGGAEAAGSAVASCKGTLVVTVNYGQNADAGGIYMKDSGVRVGGPVKVKVIGPETREELTTIGQVTFRELICGDYSIEASYDGTDPLVETAKGRIGSTRWNFAVETTSLDRRFTMPAMRNKCSFFVYDMIQSTYGTAPVMTYQRGTNSFMGRYSPFWGTLPALADDWAEDDNSADDETEGWRNIDFGPPRGTAVPPGAVLAIEIAYSDATGHVAIVAYPEDGSADGEVRGARHRATVLMQGRSISDSGEGIVHNDWGFRTMKDGAPTGPTTSLRSPDAGIEVKR